MGNANKVEPLAAAVAIILVGASVGPAGAQTRLDVYSDDFSGGSMAPPSSAVRDTGINMHIPRLHAIRDGIAALRAELGSHSHDPHTHRPHLHISTTGMSGTVGGGGDGADTVSVYSESDPTRSHSVHTSSLSADGRISYGSHTFTSRFSDSARGKGGGDGDGGGY